MRKSIRRNVYETNSSSTHSICITKSDILDQKQNHVTFIMGDYGWEHEDLNSTYDKASYLYTALQYSDGNKYLKNLKQFLDNNKIEYEFIDSSDGYIDHGNELYDFLEDVCNNEDKFMKFMFCSESFILTGNDNNDSDVEIDVSYNHDEYYKGN